MNQSKGNTMKKILLCELRKMIQAQTLLWATLTGMAISLVNVIENYFLTQWFYGVQEVINAPAFFTTGSMGHK